MHRTIKSFVLRAGRMSSRQQQGFDDWLPLYELPLDQGFWDLDALFNRQADTVVEIGFGMGASLIEMAKAQPDTNFIGIEVHRAGIGSLAADLQSQGITNVRIAPHDAVLVFNQCINENSIAGIQIFFPDPWHKKRHNKRRLIQSEWISSLVTHLKDNGFIHCATDWQDYAEHILAVLEAEPKLVNSVPEGGYCEKPDARPLTKFEQRGQKLGHGVWDLLYYKR